MSSKGLKLTLKRNKKLDRIYHSDTNLVFKSANEKIVIGRIEYDDFISLDDMCISLCEQWGLSYDESLIEQSSNTTEREEPENNQSVEQPNNTTERKEPENKETIVPTTQQEQIQDLTNHPKQLCIFDSLNRFKLDLETYNNILQERIISLETQIKELDIKYQETLESKRRLKQMISEL
jgi:hypothetical protein